MNYYNKIYYTRIGGIVKRFFAWRYAIDFIENNTVAFWSSIQNWSSGDRVEIDWGGRVVAWRGELALWW